MVETVPEHIGSTDMAHVTGIFRVEAGPGEDAGLRLAASLRSFPPPVSDWPLVAVASAMGPSLSRDAMRSFRELGVRVVALPPVRGYGFSRSLDMPAALAFAEEAAFTDQVAWISSSLGLRASPAALVGSGADFSGYPARREEGSQGPQDPSEPWLRLAGRCVGVDIEALPWVVTGESEPARIRFAVDPDLFVFRRGRGFAAELLADCLRIFQARAASARTGVREVDRVALGLSLYRQGLGHALLPRASFPGAPLSPPPRRVSLTASVLDAYRMMRERRHLARCRMA